MASKPAIITQRDVTRILKGAKAAGIEMSVVVAGGEVRFVPIGAMAKTEPPSALEAWKAQRAKEGAKPATMGDRFVAAIAERKRTKAK